MSFFLDPPALFLLGLLVYYFSKRFKWSFAVTATLMGLISVGFFLIGSTLLYLDVVAWPLPPTLGSVWMYHTDLTGIAKADVHVGLAIFMLLLYPIWHLFGYLLALRLDVGDFFLRVVSFKDVKSRKPKPETKIAVARSTSPRQNLRSVIEKLGGINSYVKHRDRVLIKANICGGNPTIPGSFASIEVVDELVKMVKEAGGSPTIVDSDMIWTKFHPVAEAEGWKDYVKKTGTPLLNLGESDQVRFDFGPESTIGIVPVSKELVNADVIISVAAMKTHLLTTVTLGMKNMYGTFPEENKAKFHRFGIENVVYEVNKAFTPILTIVDGTVGGEAFGPLSSKPVGFETIIGSNDVVAADSVACQLMGYNPLDIKHLKIADDARLGNARVVFDVSTLPYEHAKDGKWEKPEPKVSVLYEELVEAFLLVPGMQGVFDASADFVLFGLATLPVFKDLTPEVERAFNNILADVIRGLSESGVSGKPRTKDDMKKLREFMKNAGVIQ